MTQLLSSIYSINMNDSIKQLDAEALSGKLAAYGYIRPQSFSLFHSTPQKSLFEDFYSLIKSIESRTKNRRPIAVFQAISFPEPLVSLKKCVQAPEVKKVDLLNELTKLLIPEKNKRDSINKIRLEVLKQIRQGQLPQRDDIELLGQLYSLLTFKSKPFCWESPGQLKKLLTSLKKMMGNEETLEEDQKASKKMAYQQNLLLRKFIQYCFESIREGDIKKKVECLLKSPKNKKWFGVRLYKLLQEQDWTNKEMLMLTNEISKGKKLEKIKDIRLRPIRSKIGKMESNIRTHLKERSEKIEETQEASSPNIILEQDDRIVQFEESRLVDMEHSFFSAHYQLAEQSISDYLFNI